MSGKMKKKKIAATRCLLAGILFFNAAWSQSRIGDIEGSIDSNAILQLSAMANDKGLLMPKVALLSTDSPMPLTEHVEGMAVYNTAASGVHPYSVKPGFYYNDGSSWHTLSGSASVFVGDIKYSSISKDHDGWYLLNGRNINALSAAAKRNAQSLDFSVNLPDAQDAYLKGKKGDEILGSINGSNSIGLKLENLPDFKYEAATSSAGSHVHGIQSYGSNNPYDSTRRMDNTSVDVVQRKPDLMQTTDRAGAHTHRFTMSTGGRDVPIAYYPPYRETYVFIYLGN